MEKMKMHSENIVDENIAKIKKIFPSCVKESDNGNGEVKFLIDFQQLQQELSNSIVEGNKERYQLNWPGKNQALLTANAPVAKTLRPNNAESLDFENTKNLYIEGDSLDALKVIQETYLGKVKCIYIDPPYNTGEDFIYKDNYASNIEDYLKKSNQKNEVGEMLVANHESHGRFHSDWLSMLYPRLKLAWRLLTDDGLLFISIDDHEAHNMQKICAEIFSEENFLGVLSWTKRTKPINSGDAKFQIQQRIEYVLVFCKSKNRPNTYAFNLPIAEMRSYTHKGKHGFCRLKDIEDSDIGGKKRDTMKYEILGIKPNEGKRWKVGAEEAKRLIELDRVRVIDGRIKIEIYPQDEDGVKYKPFWSNLSQDDVGTAEDGKAYLNELMSAKLGFDTVKPVDLITTLLSYVPMKNDDIVLDFFSGTSTTAEGVIRQNSIDGINRRFIMVQFPEPCLDGSDAKLAGYNTISDIGKQRIRLAAKRILIDDSHDSWNKDVGFRSLFTDTSNLTDVYYNPDLISQDLLADQIDNVKPDRSAEDLLFQVLLDWGVDLSLPINKQKIQDKEIYCIDENALIACFDSNSGVDEEFVKELAKKQPLRVVFRDAGFKSDSVKINVEQIFKLISPNTDIKCI